MPDVSASVMCRGNERDVFKSFWNKYSGITDNRSMMLNQNADEFEQSDRMDILSSLPDLRGKDVVDIGAGIGRFTTSMAQTARHVLSTDFIESFIAKNRERNEKLGNVSFQVGDAVNLKLEEESVDMVFTNWLMMYLQDEEVIQFLTNALRWLRPDGYLHLRESCSEPSTTKNKTGSMHKAMEPNPTSYRFSSQYINLLKTLRHRDGNNKLWRLDPLWACSVPTYVNHSGNWRQVHWLVRKVEATDDEQVVPSLENCMQLFSDTWRQKQFGVDKVTDDKKLSWTDRILSRAIDNANCNLSMGSTVITFNPRHLAYHVEVNAHLISEKYSCNVWAVETKPYYYRTSLTKANSSKDTRVRFTWTETLLRAVDYWNGRNAHFHAFVGCETFANAPDAFHSLKKILKADARVILLEPVSSVEDEERLRQAIAASGLKNVVLLDVTTDANAAIVEYEASVTEPIVEEAPVIKGSTNETRWFLVQAVV
uniref:phosphoethanolamine N-methyltransferase n=1 Tax=Plectus sambesii TaxID=2011161 RepID=A0A914VXE0_9BILA